MSSSSFRVVLGYLEGLEKLSSIEDVRRLLGSLAKAAQGVYDSWVVVDGEYDELNGGGICHLIADEMLNVLGDHGISNVYTVSSNFEQHVYLVGAFEEGVYQIDLHHSIYETGGGFSWKKIEGVTFGAGDFTLYKLDSDVENLSQYVESD